MRTWSFVLVACAALAARAGELTVEPGGLSPQEALVRIRAAKKGGDASAWKVTVKRGVYPLKATLLFTGADSGTPAAPVVWQGEAGAVLAGGEPIVGWQVEKDGTWSAPIPAAPDGTRAYFEQLWVNGRRAPRARIPNFRASCPSNSYFRIAAPKISAVTNAAGKAAGYVENCTVTNAEAFAVAKIPADELQFAQLCVVHKWSFARRVLGGFDAATGVVTTYSPSPWHGWQKWNVRETLVSFENVRAGFDEPGEWFYDAKAGKVRYWPLKGETPETAEVIAPSAKLSRLVAFKGDRARGAYVHDVIFRNIAFCYSDATPSSPAAILAEHPEVKFPGGGRGGPTESWQHQAASASDGAVTLEYARRIFFDGCQVAHTGNYALRFNDGCTSNRVTNCTLCDTGAGGVWMGQSGGTGRVAKGEALTRRVIRNLAPDAVGFNLISNCTITSVGNFNPEATGVALTHCSDTKVVNCDIHDVFYTGVSVGFTWGFQGSVAQRNEIAFNHIHHLGKGLMSDMGGVYTLGTSYGTRVHDNVIHDVDSYSYGGWALYCDEGSEGIVMERNLCWNTTDGSFHQHYGTGCLIRNNIFAFNRIRGAVRTVRKEVQEIPCSLHFVNNIVYVKEGGLVGRGVRGVDGVWANNVWWDVTGGQEFDGLDWTGWNASGKETGGTLADPRFVDAAHFDFRLKDDSPAFARGFRVWDYSTAGRK